jgi:hypothetical protein
MKTAQTTSLQFPVPETPPTPETTDNLVDAFRAEHPELGGVGNEGILIAWLKSRYILTPKPRPVTDAEKAALLMWMLRDNVVSLYTANCGDIFFDIDGQPVDVEPAELQDIARRLIHEMEEENNAKAAK